MLLGLQPLPEPADPELNEKSQRLGTIAGAVVFGTALLFGVLGFLAADDPAGDIAAPTGEQRTDLISNLPDSSDETPSEPEAASDDTVLEATAPDRITMQLLKATGETGDATLDAYERTFAENNVEVRSTATARRTYEETTVFYEAGFEDQARALASQFGFERVEPALENLTANVMVHVVLGADAPQLLADVA